MHEALDATSSRTETSVKQTKVQGIQGYFIGYFYLYVPSTIEKNKTYKQSDPTFGLYVIPVTKVELFSTIYSIVICGCPTVQHH